MHCGIQYDGFPSFQTLMASMFSFNIQLAEIPKRKQVYNSLNTLFGGKQDRESNTTPTTPALLHAIAASIKETQKLQELWREKYKWLHFDEKENKCFARLQLISKWKKHALFLRTRTNNFQTDSLTWAHEVHEASEGLAMISAAKQLDPCKLCLLH